MKGAEKERHGEEEAWARETDVKRDKLTDRQRERAGEAERQTDRQRQRQTDTDKETERNID